MARLKQFIQQLKQRKVIRSAVVYLAVFWAAIEVADLLAGAEMLTEQLVQWLLIAGVAGFPLVLLLSWFLEAPWRERRGFSVLGDIVVIMAIAVVALLLSWQQFFTSLARPVVAVVSIEPTDAREDTRYLAGHLQSRLRMMLSTRPEIRVLELESSLHPGIDDFSPEKKALALGADFVLTGTVNQGEYEIRLNIQLFNAVGKLVWSERFEERKLDQAQLQSRVLNTLWPNLPLPEASVKETRALVIECEYPADEEAIARFMKISFLGVESPEASVSELSELIAGFQDNGLFYLQRARSYFALMNARNAAARPVAYNLGMNDLQRAGEECPSHPEIELVELSQTRRFSIEPGKIEAYLARYPNAAGLILDASRAYLEAGDEPAGLALAAEAWQLNPLGSDPLCHYRATLNASGNPDSGQVQQELRSRIAMVPGAQHFDCP